MTDLPHLDAVCRAATPGPWEKFYALFIIGKVTRVKICEVDKSVDRDFIATCSPDLVLELVSRIRELEAMNHTDRAYLTQKESKLAARVRELEGIVKSCLQTACDADEAPAGELLRQVADQCSAVIYPLPEAGSASP